MSDVVKVASNSFSITTLSLINLLQMPPSSHNGIWNLFNRYPNERSS